MNDSDRSPSDSTARLRSLLGSIDEVVFEFDRDGTYLSVWTEDDSLLAQPREHLLGRTLAEVLGEDAARPFEDAVRQVLASGEPLSFEYQLRVQGGERWFLARVNTVAAPGGAPRTVSFLARDITARVQAERALRESEERYRLISDLTSDFAISYDIAPDGRATVRWMDEAVTHITGFTAEDVDARGWSSAIHPADLPIVREQQQRLLAGKSDVREFRILTKDGRTIWTRSAGRPVWDEQAQRVVRIDTAFQDTTEEARAWEALRGSERRYRNLYDAAQRQAQERDLLDQVRSAIAVELDLAVILRTVVESVAATFDYSHVSAYLRSGDALRLQHQVGYAEVISEIPRGSGVSWQVVESGRPILLEDVSTDPSFLSAVEGLQSEVCVPLFDEQTVVGILNIESTSKARLNEADLALMEALAQHVNLAIERARLHTEQLQSELRFRTVFENSPVGILTADANGVVTSINDAYLKFIGDMGLRDDIVGRHNLKTVEAFRNAGISHLFNGLFEGRPFTVETPLTTTAGRDTVVRYDAAPLLSATHEIEGAVVVADDISERVRAQQEMERRANALAALYRTSLEIGAHRELSELLQAIVRRAAALIGTQMGGLMLLQEDGETLSLVAAHNQPEDLLGLRLQRGEGLAWQVFEAGAPMTITDYPNYPHRLRSAAGAHIQRIVSVPLMSGGRAIGVINCFDTDRADPFDEDDIALLQQFAAQATLAIENTRLLDQVGAARERLRLMNQIKSAILAAETQVDIAQAALQYIIPLFRCWRADVISFDLESNTGTVLAVVPDVEHTSYYAAGTRLPIDDLQPLQDFAQGITTVVSDLEDESQQSAVTRNLLTEGMRSYISVPLVSRGTLIGSLQISSDRPDFFGPESLELAREISDSLAVGIENARLFEAEQRRTAELEAVRQAALQLTSRLELHPVLDSILKSSLDLIEADNAHIFLYQQGVLTFGAARWAGSQQKEPYSVLRPEGLTYTVARSGERIVVEDMRRHELFADRDWEGAIVGIPLHFDEQVRGVMNVSYDHTHAFTGEQLRLLALLADQAAVALKNAQLFDAEQRQARQLAALSQLGQAVTSRLELEQVLQQVIGEVQGMVDAEGVSILLPDGDSLVFAAVNGMAAEGLQGQRMPIAAGVAGEVFQSRRSEWINDETSRARIYRQIEETSGYHTEAMLAAPLFLGDETLGVMEAVHTDPNAFGPGDLILIEAAARWAAIAISNAQLYEAQRLQAEQLQALRQTGLEITAQLDVNTVLNSIVARAIELFGANGGGLYLYDAKEDVLRWTVGIGPHILPVGTTTKPGEGFSGRIFSSGEPLFVEHYQEWEHARPTHAASEPFAVLGAPVRWAGNVLGVLNVMAHAPRRFMGDEADMLTLFADHAAIALQNARLYESERTARRHAETLQATTADLAATLELEPVLESILEHLSELVEYDSACVFLVEGEHLRALAHRNLADPDSVLGIPLPIEQDRLFQSIRASRAPLWLPDARTHPDFHGLGGTENIRGWLGVPFLRGGEVVGYLTIDSLRPAAYDEEHAALAQTFANQAAVAIHNARLFEQVRSGRERLQTLSNRLVDIQEKERAHIARELHDEIGQVLTAVKIGLQSAQRDKQVEVIHAYLQDTLVIVEDAILRTRDLSLELRPALLDDLGLPATLRWYLDRQAQLGGFSAQLDVQPSELRLPHELEVAGFRIIQEALTNVLRYADAHNVSVRVQQSGDDLTIVVEDDGVGFDVNAALDRAARGEHIGLLGMQERALQLGGVITIESEPGRGARVLAHVPLVDRQIIERRAPSHRNH